MGWIACVALFAAFGTVGYGSGLPFADSGIVGSYSADQVDAGIADSCYEVRPEAGDIAAEADSYFLVVPRAVDTAAVAGSCFSAATQADDTAVAAAVEAGGSPAVAEPEPADQGELFRC